MEITANSALIIIDVQKAIDLPSWGTRNNLDAEIQMSKLLKAWREKNLPLFHIRHDSTEAQSGYRPGGINHAFKDEVAPLDLEMVIGKSTNSAFVGTGLADILNEARIENLFVFGVKTNNSVETTVRHGANVGFNITLIEDACFTHNLTDWQGVNRSAEDVHAMSLANLNGEYCAIVKAEDVISALTLF